MLCPALVYIKYILLHKLNTPLEVTEPVCELRYKSWFFVPMGVFFRGGSFLVLNYTIPRRKFRIFVPVPRQILDSILEDGVCIRDFSLCHFCLNAFLPHNFQSGIMTSPNMGVLTDMSRALAYDVINNSTIRYSTTRITARRHITILQWSTLTVTCLHYMSIWNILLVKLISCCLSLVYRYCLIYNSYWQQLRYIHALHILINTAILLHIHPVKVIISRY